MFRWSRVRVAVTGWLAGVAALLAGTGLTAGVRQRTDEESEEMETGDAALGDAGVEVRVSWGEAAVVGYRRASTSELMVEGAGEVGGEVCESM